MKKSLLMEEMKIDSKLRIDYALFFDCDRHRGNRSNI